MNLSRADKARLLFGLSIIAPTVSVQAARLLFRGEPPAAQVSAATTGAESSITPQSTSLLAAAPKPLTQSQAKAAEYLSGRTRPQALASPMDHPDPEAPIAIEPAPAPVQSDEPAPVAVTPDEPDPATALTVSSIFSDQSQSLAMINHVIRHVGDEVMKGWTITEIDGKKRVVTLRHTSGRTVELMPR